MQYRTTDRQPKCYCTGSCTTNIQQHLGGALSYDPSLSSPSLAPRVKLCINPVSFPCCCCNLTFHLQAVRRCSTSCWWKTKPTDQFPQSREYIIWNREEKRKKTCLQSISLNKSNSMLQLWSPTVKYKNNPVIDVRDRTGMISLDNHNHNNDSNSPFIYIHNIRRLLSIFRVKWKKRKVFRFQ